MSLVVAMAVGAVPWWAAVAIATAPLALPIVRIVRESGDPRKLNFALLKTAGLHMQFGAAMAAGLVMNWIATSV